CPQARLRRLYAHFRRSGGRSSLFSHPVVKVSSATSLMIDQTTQRRSSTETLGDRDGRLAIVWVHPETEGRGTFGPPGRTILGRDFTCDIRLPGHETSRQHAEIVRESVIVVVGDLNSMNGTQVDGRRVSRAPIDDGSVIRIGDWVGVVVRLAGEQE